jgi:hypothetical protein
VTIEEKRRYWRERKARERPLWTPEYREERLTYIREWRKNNPTYGQQYAAVNAERRRGLARERNKRPEVRAKRAAEHAAWRASLSPEQKEALLARNRQYQKNHPDSIRRPHRSKIERMKNPVFGVVKNLRRRVNDVIRRNLKSASTLTLLGCSVDQFLGHLEINFEEGMAWDNYGSAWHVDHRRPCASFDLTKPEEQRICFNWKNLQPLFAKDNLRKGAKHISSFANKEALSNSGRF